MSIAIKQPNRHLHAWNGFIWKQNVIEKLEIIDFNLEIESVLQVKFN